MRRLIAVASFLSFLAFGPRDRGSSALAETVTLSVTGAGYGNVNVDHQPLNNFGGPVSLSLSYDWEPGIVPVAGVFKLDSLVMHLSMNTPLGQFAITASGAVLDEIIVGVPSPDQGPAIVSFIAEDLDTEIEIDMYDFSGTIVPGMLPDSLQLEVLMKDPGEFEASDNSSFGGNGYLMGYINPEPPSIVMMVLGLAGVSRMAARRRRGRRDGAALH
jgi:hypothetical protein